MNRLPETGDGTVTSWIPITTTHAQRPDCSEMYWSYVGGTIAAWDPGYGISVSSNECVPRPVTTWWDQDRLGSNPSTVISLGPLTCPDAYFTATTSVKDSSSTLVACCPSGYTFVSFFQWGLTGECYTKVDSGDVIQYAIRDQSQNWEILTTTIDEATTIAGIPVNGWVFASETSTPASSGSAATAGTTTQASGSTSSCAASSSGLTAGSKAGIGVGVALGVVGLATLAAGLFMMRKARRRPNYAPPAGVEMYDPSKPPLYGNFQAPTAELANHSGHAELPGSPNQQSYMPSSVPSPPSATTTAYLPPGEYQQQR